nr:hypothetical protein [Eubacterium sp.]
DKFCDLCEVAMRDVCDMQAHENETSITDVKAYAGNMLYVCDVESLSRETVEKLRGRFGAFFQYVISGVEELRPAMDDPKVQTCAVYGVDPEVVRDVVVKNGYYGVDRVVPFGHTLDIDVIWDGYDLVAEMSRIIN